MVGKSHEGPAGGAPEAATGQAAAEEAAGSLIIAKGGDAVAPAGRPRLFERRRKKRRKLYTRGTKDLQRMQRAFTKAGYRLSNAGTVAIARFDRESGRSARRKRDGAMVDFVDNLARATTDGMEEATRVPLEVAKGINGRMLWRGAKRTARVIIAPAFWR